MNIQELLAGLKSLQLVRIRVGPAGVHYDFAKNPQMPLAMGILSNTGIHLYYKDCGKIWEVPRYPPYDCQPQLERRLVGRVVTEAEIQSENNAALIVLDDQIALKLLPETMNPDVGWSIHRRSPDDVKRDWIPGLVVTAHALSEVESFGL